MNFVESLALAHHDDKSMGMAMLIFLVTDKRDKNRQKISSLIKKEVR